MQKFFYDMHLHSCLSPCGDDDMTPANIAGMAALKGLDIIALCDHNTTANCPAFFSCCRKNGIIPIAGMELTTAEEIHLICLFKTLEDALRFGKAVDGERIKIKNKTEIFGNQYITDENDEIIGEDEFLLPNATRLSLSEGAALCRENGGLCYPAHIDRPSNGIVGVLGSFPDSPGFTCVEYHDKTLMPEYEAKYPLLAGKKKLTSSDAHYLWDINERENFIELEDEPYSSALVTARLFDFLSH